MKYDINISSLHISGLSFIWRHRHTWLVTQETLFNIRYNFFDLMREKYNVLYITVHITSSKYIFTITKELIRSFRIRLSIVHKNYTKKFTMSFVQKKYIDQKQCEK